MRTLTLLMGFLSFSVFAQGKAATAVVYDKKTKLDFEEKSVDGEFLKPDSLAVSGDQNTDFDSLMSARKNFKKELKRSSGAIR